MHIANDSIWLTWNRKKQIKAEAIGSNNAYISCITMTEAINIFSAINQIIRERKGIF